MKSWMIAIVLLGCSSTNFSGETTSTQKIKQLDAEKAPPPKRAETDGENNSGTGDLDGSSDNDQPSIIIDGDSTTPPKVPQFGLLVNDLQCSFCHLKINGDIASTGDVPAFWPGSYGHVNGTWFVAGNFNGDKTTTLKSKTGAAIRAGESVSLTVTGGIKQQNVTAPAIPKNKVTKKPEFPVIDFDGLTSKMKGKIKVGSTEVNDIHQGNLVLVGTDAAPIEIEGEVLINGDLVIKGTYAGLANIYVTGNIYIPADLVGQTSPFPYSEDPSEALEQAKAAIANKFDALGLASAKSIIVSDFDTHGPGNRSVFDHEWTPAVDSLEALGINNVYQWYPGGQVGFASLFEGYDFNCAANDQYPRNNRSISRIDAYLYAMQAVGGRANRNSYAINGGVIANHFHIISGAAHCPDQVHPKFRQNARMSYVNYDWRMKAGLLLLKQLEDYFEPIPAP